MKTLDGREYKLAINGTILPATYDDHCLTLDLEHFAEMFSIEELATMLKSKRESNRIRELFRVTNKELSNWLEAKPNRRLHVTQPGQKITEGISQTTWPYTEEDADCDANATSGYGIYVVEAGSCTLVHLDRKAIGLA